MDLSLSICLIPVFEIVFKIISENKENTISVLSKNCIFCIFQNKKTRKTSQIFYVFFVVFVFYNRKHEQTALKFTRHSNLTLIFMLSSLFIFSPCSILPLTICPSIIHAFV